MAKIIIESYDSLVTNKFGNTFVSPRKHCVCSECGGIIVAPVNGAVYRHCYNCGAKFDIEYGCDTLRNLKQAR